mgnify:CR=1 FL=1
MMEKEEFFGNYSFLHDVMFHTNAKIIHLGNGPHSTGNFGSISLDVDFEVSGDDAHIIVPSIKQKDYLDDIRTPEGFLAFSTQLELGVCRFNKETRSMEEIINLIHRVPLVRK